MMIPNRERLLVALLRRIAEEEGLELTGFSHDWILRLRRGEQARFIYGYNFDLNSAAGAMITQDKSATSDVLAEARIPHVEHAFFLTPVMGEFIGENGHWERALAFVRRHGYPVVCKANQGTGGGAVFRVTDQRELELTFQTLFQQERGICLSPYYEIDCEYRVIILHGRVALCYAKRRPALVGNGRHSLGRLLVDAADQGRLTPATLESALREGAVDLGEIIPDGRSAPLTWKHNLGQGAVPEPVTDPDRLRRLEALALQAVRACRVTFASVDIIETEHEDRVLEINAGIMMEQYARTSPRHYEQALEVYRKAVRAMFDPTENVNARGAAPAPVETAP